MASAGRAWRFRYDCASERMRVFACSVTSRIRGVSLCWCRPTLTIWGEKRRIKRPFSPLISCDLWTSSRCCRIAGKKCDNNGSLSPILISSINHNENRSDLFSLAICVAWLRLWFRETKSKLVCPRCVNDANMSQSYRLSNGCININIHKAASPARIARIMRTERTRDRRAKLICASCRCDCLSVSRQYNCAQPLIVGESNYNGSDGENATRVNIAPRLGF
jgi:hypothetical protein